MCINTTFAQDVETFRRPQKHIYTLDSQVGPFLWQVIAPASPTIFGQVGELQRLSSEQDGPQG